LAVPPENRRLFVACLCCGIDAKWQRNASYRAPAGGGQ
jgi:hypothetical protein